MDKRFVQVKHMYASERETGVYYEAGKIIINLDHIISLKPHSSLNGYYYLTMVNDIQYVVDHSILSYFPLLGEENLDQNIF